MYGTFARRTCFRFYCQRTWSKKAYRDGYLDFVVSSDRKHLVSKWYRTYRIL